MEDNYPYMYDEIVGMETFNIGSLVRDKWVNKTFKFNDVRTVMLPSHIPRDLTATWKLVK